MLKQIREIEVAEPAGEHGGVKVIITTAVDERESIIEAFRSQCDAYLVKPISREQLMAQIESLGLLPNE